MMAGAYLAIISAVGLFTALVILAWAFQESVAFQPGRPPYPESDGVPRTEYTAADGQPLFAYVIGEPSADSSLLLAFHGNADLAVRQIGWARELHKRTGICVMVAEYRGYMGLTGRPSYAASRLDADAAHSVVRDTFGIAPDRVALFGHSLGTAIATELAARNHPAALILQSPFTSARAMAALMVGNRVSSILWPSISRLHYDTLDRVAALDVPVSVAHGGLDRVIPSWMGQSVFAAARIKGTWLFVPDASHGDVESKGGVQYWNWIEQTLEPLPHRSQR